MINITSSYIGYSVIWEYTGYNKETKKDNTLVKLAGIIDSITIDLNKQVPNFYTVKFSNGRTHNFTDKLNPLSNNIIAQDINELKLNLNY